MKFSLNLKITAILMLITNLTSYCQTEINYDDNTINIDLFKAPQSPAAVLLGIGDSEITRPSDPTAFMLSLRQVTSNFTNRPSNYAVDIAPLWVFKGKNIKFEKFMDHKSIANNIRQSCVLSFAVHENPLKDETNVDIPNSAVGLGLKFSLLRGKVNDQFNDAINKSKNILDSINFKSQSMANEYLKKTAYYALKDSLIKCYSSDCDSLKRAYLQKAIELEMKKAEVNALNALNGFKDEEKKLIKLSSEIDFKRIGWTLDFNCGVSYDFPNYIFNERKFAKAGVWVSGGYEFPENLILLGIARLLYNPDQIFADPNGILKSKDNQAFDWGMRGIYSINDFSLSGELVYRSVLNNTEIKPGFKYQINAEYTVANNIKLIVNLGKNFDGTITGKGNVIAALNFIMGFGGEKKL